MTLEDALTLFRRHLETEKIRSKETVRPYMADLQDFREYLESITAAEALTNVQIIDRFHTRGFLASRFGKIKKISVGRKLAAIRTFFRFLLRERRVEANPAAGIRSPKCEKPLPKALSVDETDRFFTRTLDQGKRDLAMFELLYSSGLRVGELTSLDVHDVDLSSGWVRVIGKGNKERYVPVGSKAVQALKDYIPLRDLLEANNPATGRGRPLFLNARGARSHRAAFGVYSRRFSSLQTWGGTCPRTRFAIRLRLICSRAGRICDRYKSFSGTRAFPPPSVIPAWTWGDSWKCTIDLTPEADVTRRTRVVPRANEGFLPLAHDVLAQYRRIARPNEYSPHGMRNEPRRHEDTKGTDRSAHQFQRFLDHGRFQENCSLTSSCLGDLWFDVLVARNGRGKRFRNHGSQLREARSRKNSRLLTFLLKTEELSD